MKIAILGMGTVGSGVLSTLQENRDKINALLNEPIDVTHVFAGQINKKRPVDLSGIDVTDNIETLYQADLDLVVEVLGGVAFPKEIISTFLSKGVHVVTANKDLLALHIDELASIGNAHQATLMYEAAVAGGIPIINALTVGLASNQIQSIVGILNGTTNYILSHMTQDDWNYQQALDAAKKKGFAEADPTNDVGGFDARRKIALLSRLAFDTRVNLDDIWVRGIDQVKSDDIELGKQNGYVLKLVGKSIYQQDNVICSVEPIFLPESHPLASVNEAYNAVYVEGNAVGKTMFWGPGAGSTETGSAIVSDIMQIATRGFIPNRIPTAQLKVHSGDIPECYYLRFDNKDEAKHVLLKHKVSYEQLANGDQYVVVTEPITIQTLQEMKQDIPLVAYYQMIKE